MTSILSFCYSNSDQDSGLIPIKYSSEIISLDEASNQLPEGAYTTFRTYPNISALHLEDHIQRLRESSQLAGYPIMLDGGKLRTNIRRALLQFPAEVARVRVMVPFGDQKPVVYIFIGALTVPTELQRQRGVKVITSTFHREAPAAKLTGFIKTSQTLRQKLSSDLEEVIMVDEHNHLLEGLTSNFYAVSDGTIFTAGEGVLHGITRQIVLEIVRSAGIQINLTPPEIKNIARFAEAFITSSSRGVLPVTEIDNQPVGSWNPGNITCVLMELYDKQVLAEIEPI